MLCLIDRYCVIGRYFGFYILLFLLFPKCSNTSAVFSRSPLCHIGPQVTTIIQLLREQLFFSHMIPLNGHLCNFRLQRYNFFLICAKKIARLSDFFL